MGLLGARRSRAGAWVEAPSACHGGGGLAEVAGAGGEPHLGAGSGGAEAAWSDPPAARMSATGRSTKSRSTTPVTCTPPRMTETSRMHSTGQLWRRGGSQEKVEALKGPRSSSSEPRYR